MRRALAVLAISVFAVTASAAPRNDRDGGVIDRIARIIHQVVRHIVPMDDLMPPK